MQFPSSELPSGITDIPIAHISMAILEIYMD